MTMTLSVVPVRFAYACGHTALVSLPRVKAERPDQRTARVNQEKAAAGQRSCDFCPPVPPPVVGSNDLNDLGAVAGISPVGSSMIDGTNYAPPQHMGTADRA